MRKGKKGLIGRAACVLMFYLWQDSKKAITQLWGIGAGHVWEEAKLIQEIVGPIHQDGMAKLMMITSKQNE